MVKILLLIVCGTLSMIPLPQLLSDNFSNIHSMRIVIYWTPLVRMHHTTRLWMWQRRVGVKKWQHSWRVCVILQEGIHTDKCNVWYGIHSSTKALTYLFDSQWIKKWCHTLGGLICFSEKYRSMTWLRSAWLLALPGHPRPCKVGTWYCFIFLECQSIFLLLFQSRRLIWNANIDIQFRFTKW